MAYDHQGHIPAPFDHFPNTSALAGHEGSGRGLSYLLVSPPLLLQGDLLHVAAGNLRGTANLSVRARRQKWPCPAHLFPLAVGSSAQNEFLVLVKL